MTRNKPTVTIGIPALNEESSIGQLLLTLLNQHQLTYQLSQIVVSSDGSSDKTVSIARSFKNKLIKVSNNKYRKGKAHRQNQIIKQSTSDILIILDGDIVISSNDFVDQLIQPLIASQADMTSAALVELPARNYFESVIHFSMDTKKRLFENWNQGHNLYNCHGPARAFTRSLYKSLSFPSSVGEDMFSFLFCLSANMKFRYVPTALVWYQLPDTPLDHLKQSSRYLETINLMKGYFNPGFVNRHLSIPKQVYWQTIKNNWFWFLLKTDKIFTYFLVWITSYILHNLQATSGETWQVASTKVAKVNQ